MEPRVTESDLVMLLLDEDDLLALGAMLSLPAQSFDLTSDDGEEEEGGFAYFRRAPTSHV